MTSTQDHSLTDLLALDVSSDAKGAVFGLVWAIGVDPGRYPTDFEHLLAPLLARRAGDLSAEEDAARRAARDMLRYGKYKPTGRGKPASEYLIRAAREDTFPRISPPVDICNYISLKHLVPASIWDLELGGRSYVARRGREGESYVFNASGQSIDLQDLLLLAGEDDVAMVNPVKDCHRTKTTASSRNVAAVVYLPEPTAPDTPALLAEFARLLAGCGESVKVGTMHMRRGA